jgi:competence protein ComGF
MEIPHLIETLNFERNSKSELAEVSNDSISEQAVVKQKEGQLIQYKEQSGQLTELAATAEQSFEN